jgi:hypothetical protein
MTENMNENMTDAATQLTDPQIADVSGGYNAQLDILTRPWYSYPDAIVWIRDIGDHVLFMDREGGTGSKSGYVVEKFIEHVEMVKGNAYEHRYRAKYRVAGDDGNTYIVCDDDVRYMGVYVK